MSIYDKIQRHARRLKRLTVTFGPAHGDGERATGFTEDVSGSGMFVQSGKIYPPRTVLLLATEIDGKELQLTGRVIWAKKAPLSLMGKKRCGMGIQFDRVCEVLERFASS